ncbi:MAG: hypothetical protein N3D20_00715 [Candidatus Pacearchaeota archaeon]|nr:hypothetical protein [Candidatus Pacearchaeota archaeon]
MEYSTTRNKRDYRREGNYKSKHHPQKRDYCPERYGRQQKMLAFKAFKEKRLALIKERHNLMKKERELIEEELKKSKLEKELEKEIREDEIDEQ